MQAALLSFYIAHGGGESGYLRILVSFFKEGVDNTM